jgi:3-hydroxyisobutyrate dehydrogenase
MERIGWIGVGLMGSRMLRRVMQAGYPASIYARNPDAARAFVDAGAAICGSPSEVARRSDVVITVVSTPADVAATYLGPNGLLEGAQPQSALIDMTTSSPELARQIAAACENLKVHSLDAPVSGGTAGAEAGTLSIMVGGDPEALQRTRPILDCMGSKIIHQGPPGSGQATKMANQIAIAGSMLGICEAFLFATASGLSQDKVLETIASGIVGSDLFRYVWSRLSVADLAPGFRVDLLIKDLGIALRSSQELAVPLPGAALVDELYKIVSRAGYGDRGTQALIVGLDPTWTLPSGTF